MSVFSQHTILFDGVCNLCNGFVQFIIKRDQQGKFKFGALQSMEGAKLLSQYNLSEQHFDSVVLIKGGKIYKKSTAVLIILKEMGGVWVMFYPFIILPSLLRDLMYDFVAQNRYRWFGKKNQCMTPTPELKNRFLKD